MTLGDKRNSRLYTTNRGISYKLEENSGKYLTLSSEDLEEERHKWVEAAHVVNNRDFIQLNDKRIKLRPPSEDTLLSRKTKNRTNAKCAKEVEVYPTLGQYAVEALTSENVLNIIFKMEENYKSNVNLINRIAAENKKLENRVKKLENAIQSNADSH